MCEAIVGTAHDREEDEFGEHPGAVECVGSNSLQLAERVCEVPLEECGV
jgi:hypothetical protein